MKVAPQSIQSSSQERARDTITTLVYLLNRSWAVRSSSFHRYILILVKVNSRVSTTEELPDTTDEHISYKLSVMKMTHTFPFFHFLVML